MPTPTTNGAVREIIAPMPKRTTAPASSAAPTPAKGKSALKAGLRSGKPPMAATADRHMLYEHAVQCVESEIDFVDDTFKDLRGRRARLLREDFCGTGNTSCEWVRRRPTNRAIAVDLDPEVLDWGRRNKVMKLKPSARSRVEMIEADVRTVKTEPVDAVLAMNFSYWLFMTRDALRGYFESVRRSLADGGVFFLDCYGGSDAFKEVREKRKVELPDGGEFTYVWDQHSFDPVSNRMECYIHFHFPDGSKMNRAFSYGWRLWTLPEIREVLAEAGFERSTVYWEGTDEDTGEGDGVFEPVDRGDADPSWICYIVAEK